MRALGLTRIWDWLKGVRIFEILYGGHACKFYWRMVACLPFCGQLGLDTSVSKARRFYLQTCTEWSLAGSESLQRKM